MHGQARHNSESHSRNGVCFRNLRERPCIVQENELSNTERIFTYGRLPRTSDSCNVVQPQTRNCGYCLLQRLPEASKYLASTLQ